MSWWNIGRLLNPKRDSFVAGGNVAAQRPRAITVEKAKANATVFSSVKLITNTVSKLPLEAPDNPSINRILASPNILQNGATFHGDIVDDLLCHGNAFISMKRGPAGSLIGLYSNDPDELSNVEVKVDGSVEYQFNDGQTFKNQRIAGKNKFEMIHVRDGGGSKPLAVSRLYGIQTSLRALIEADKLIADVFKNGPSVSYFIRSQDGKKLGKDDIDELEKRMRRFIASTTLNDNGDEVKSRGGFAYIGTLEVAPTKGLTPADADLRNLRSDLKLEIAAGFGVPPFRAGGDANTKYSNAQAANAALIKDEILSIVENTTKTFSEALGVKITCDTSRLVKGDLGEQLKAAVAARGGPVMGLDESRKLVDLAPPDDKTREEIMQNTYNVAFDPDPTDGSGEDDRRGERADIPEEQQRVRRPTYITGV